MINSSTYILSASACVDVNTRFIAKEIGARWNLHCNNLWTICIQDFHSLKLIAEVICRHNVLNWEIRVGEILITANANRSSCARCVRIIGIECHAKVFDTL